MTVLVAIAYLVLLLMPGMAAWRLLRRGRPTDRAVDLAGAIACGFSIHALLLGIAFAVGLPLWTVAAAALALGVVHPLRSLARLRPAPVATLIGLTAGLAGVRLWTLGGDAPYHVGRVRRLLTLDGLDLSAMPELVGGSNHPGYYVPLSQALVGESGLLTGAAPEDAYRAVTLAVALLAALVAAALVGSLTGDRRLATVGAGIAAIVGLAAQREWSFIVDAPSTATQLLWPALALLALAYARERSRSALAGVLAASVALTLVHVTYVPFALIALGGAAVGAALRDRRIAIRTALPLALAVGAPFVVYGAALWSVARGTSERVGSGQRLVDGLAKWQALDQIAYVGRFVVVHPRMLAGAGLLAVAIAVAVLIPALRRREAAYVSGGLAALVVFALVPPLPGLLGRLVSVNQIRRMPFLELPWLLVAVGALALAVVAGKRRALPVALVLGVVLGVVVPERSGAETLVAAAVCAGAALAALALHRPGIAAFAPRASLVAIALVAPFAASSLPPFARALVDLPPPAETLSDGAVAAVRALPDFTVIASDLEPSLLLTALTDALVYAVPPGNTADTPENRPTERVRANRRLLDPEVGARRRRLMLEIRGIDCLLVDRTRRPTLADRLTDEGYPQRFADQRFALFCRR